MGGSKCLLLIGLLSLLGLPVDVVSRTITFSGRDWNVRETTTTTQAPGNNWWSDSTSNVWVDSNGRLHLKVTHVNGKWLCPEVYTTGNVRYGKFNWNIEGSVHTTDGSFDKNIVFGMFTYPTAGSAEDRTDEIDIELSRWGNSANDNLSFTSYPDVLISGFTNHSVSTMMNLSGTYTSHEFEWRASSIKWVSRHGHSSTDSVIMSHTYTGDSSPSTRIPQSDCKTHINLWLVNGSAPTDGVQYEYIIHSFTYTA